MTAKECEELRGKPLGVKDALHLAFKAGAAEMLGCFKSFAKSHMREEDVIGVLLDCAERKMMTDLHAFVTKKLETATGIEPSKPTPGPMKCTAPKSWMPQRCAQFGGEGKCKNDGGACKHKAEE